MSQLLFATFMHTGYNTSKTGKVVTLFCSNLENKWEDKSIFTCSNMFSVLWHHLNHHVLGHMLHFLQGDKVSEALITTWLLDQHRLPLPIIAASCRGNPSSLEQDPHLNQYVSIAEPSRCKHVHKLSSLLGLGIQANILPEITDNYLNIPSHITTNSTVFQLVWFEALSMNPWSETTSQQQMDKLIQTLKVCLHL